MQDTDTDAESDEDSYWNQYDQFSVPALGEQSNTPKEPLSRDQDPSNYFDRYDNIETVIGDPHPAAQPSANIRGEHRERLPTSRNEVADIGLDDYIRDTVRSLSQLALRGGISKIRLAEIISEELN